MSVELGTAFVDVQGDFTSLNKQIDAALGPLGAKLGKFGKVGAAGVAGIAGGAAVAGAALYDIGSKFDDAYDSIRVATGKTGKSLAGLQGDFKSVVKTVPTDFESASKAIGTLNSRLGVSGKPLRTLSTQFLELSRITGTDLSSNIESVTRVFGDWAIKTKNQPKALDALFRASQKTGVPVQKLGEMIVKYGAPLRQLGFSFEQSAAMVGKFEKEGVNTQLVMGSMRVALGKLAKEGKNPQTEFAKITKRIKEAGSAGEANKLALETFGARAGPDMAAAIREGRLSLGDLTKSIAGGKETIIGAGKDTQDFAEKWQVFKNKILVGLEPLATRVFGAVGSAMDNIGPIASTVQSIVGKVAAAFKGTGDSAGPLARLLASLKTTFDVLKTTVSTFVQIAVLAWDKFGGVITDQARNILNTLAGVVEGVTKVLQGVVDVIAGVFTGDWSRAWDGVKSIFAGVWTAIGAIFTGALNNLVNGFRLVLIALLAVGNELLGQFVALGQSIVGSIVGGIQSVASVILGAAVWLFNTVKAGIEAYLTQYASIGSWILDRLADGLTTVTTALAGAWGWLRNRIAEGMAGVASGLTAIGSYVLNRIVDGLTTLVAALAGFGGWLRNRISDGLTAVATGLTAVGSYVLNRIVDGITTVTDTLSGVGGWVKNRLVEAFTGAKDGITGIGGSIIGWIVDGLKAGANLVVRFLNSLIGKINSLPLVKNIPDIAEFAQGGEFKAKGLARGGAFGRTGGYVNSPITLMGEEAPRYPEFVIPTNPAYRGRARGLLNAAANVIAPGMQGFDIGGVFGSIGGALKDVASESFGTIKGIVEGVMDLPSIPKMPAWAGSLVETVLKRLIPFFKKNAGAPAKMIAFGDKIARKGLGYTYGGGHGGWQEGAFDCSGFVSAILHAGLPKLLSSPITTDGLKVLGESGNGDAVTWGVRGSTGKQAHTMIKVLDNYYESSGRGTGKRSGWSGSFDMYRHPPGLAEGGVFGFPVNSKEGRALTDLLGWGLAGGGTFTGSIGAGVGANVRGAGAQMDSIGPVVSPVNVNVGAGALDWLRQFITVEADERARGRRGTIAQGVAR